MVTSFSMDIRGLAAEKEEYAKTHDVPNGSTYYEIDGDHKVYMFDRKTMTWIEQ